jgi:hypothetical protein
MFRVFPANEAALASAKEERQMDQQKGSPPTTGLVCPACRKPVGIIENRLPKILIFLCPACGNRWSAEEPGVKRQ